MRRFRPRISLLTALLLMTIVGMAIVMIQLWNEVGPLRAEVQQLRDQVGVLTIEDESKIHAIAVPTDHEGVWKWRVYIPPGQSATLMDKWGDVPRTGYPSGGHQAALGPGEQLLTLTVKKLDPAGNSWIGQFRTPAAVLTVSINAEDYYFSGPSSAMNRGVTSGTETVGDDGKLMLMRSRVAPAGQSSLLDKDNPLPGFIIWLERQ